MSAKKKELTISNGIEVGNIFKLGDKYTKTMQMKYVDENGKEQIPIMGCYGIGVGRLMASVLEAKATQKSVNWPVSIAPYDVHICPIDYKKNENVKDISNKIYNNLMSQGLDVLLDDRNKSTGVTFADADLIGAPIRIIVGNRNLVNNSVEIKISGKDESILVNIEKVTDFVKTAREELLKEVN